MNKEEIDISQGIHCCYIHISGDDHYQGHYHCAGENQKYHCKCGFSFHPDSHVEDSEAIIKEKKKGHFCEFHKYCSNYEKNLTIEDLCNECK